MTGIPTPLSGSLRHSDVQPLRDWAMTRILSGGLTIEATDLDEIETGPMQVLLAAAAEARRKGLPCALSEPAVPAVDRRLAALRLPPADRFFTIIPQTAVTQ